jgi:hypothetical protein
VLNIKYKIKTQKIPYCPNTYKNHITNALFLTVLTVYSKIHSAASDYVTGAIHTFLQYMESN